MLNGKIQDLRAVVLTHRMLGLAESLLLIRPLLEVLVRRSALISKVRCVQYLVVRVVQPKSLR